MPPSTDALFNANYLPTKLLHRDQELTALSNLISKNEDSTNSINVLVHGSFGIGRTTLLRFFGQHELIHYHLPFIRFHGKSSSEIISDTLHSLIPFHDSTCSIPEQLLLIKRLIRKAEVPLVFLFDDVDSSTYDVYGKFLNICRENGVSSMATAPRYAPRNLDPYTSQLLDVAIELEPFTDRQFLDIVKQRVGEVFPQPVPSQITEFMADLICVLDFQRPATVVELLQNLHPLVTSPSLISADSILQSCLNSRTLHYDFWGDHLSAIPELDVVVVLLLQAVGQYFVTHPRHIYVTKTSLYTQFQQVMEEIGMPSSFHQFTRALNMVLFQDLLLQSRYTKQSYFTLLPAEGYLEIVELMLGECRIEP